MTGHWTPNWYDDGQGRLRWWDGRRWTKRTRSLASDSRVSVVVNDVGSSVGPIEAALTRAQSRVADAAGRAASGIAAAEQQVSSVAAEKRSKEPKRGAPASPADRSRRRFILPVVVGVVALVMGLGIGASGSRSEPAPAAVEPTKSAEYVALQSHLTAVTADRDTLQQQVDDARDQTAALDARTQGLDAREADLDSLDKKLARKSKKLDARAASISGTPADTASSASSGTSEVAYYANCDAARAAGAAPVHSGDPGYSSRLDRDGDGVGCE